MTSAIQIERGEQASGVSQLGLVVPQMEQSARKNAELVGKIAAIARVYCADRYKNSGVFAFRSLSQRSGTR